ncbi:MAG TPA: hypothetical protein VN931_03460 [Fibrobacteria bacterium]|nr:hypothetical protein [Fibrobacteria bacterium]
MTKRTKQLSISLAALAAPLLALAPNPDQPPNESLIYDIPWGMGNAQWGKQLFWYKADSSQFADDRASADKLVSQGVAPVMSAVCWAGSNRWGDTSSSNPGAMHTDPAWVAYTYWEYAHDSLTPVNNSGQYVAPLGSNTDYGWISPAEPMPASDCPAGMQTCVWGDWAAERVARLCQATHMVGLAAADYVDGMPGYTANQIDFNQRVIQAFEDTTGITVPGATVSAQATYINAHLASRWADFWDDSWAHFYTQMAQRVKLYTGKDALIQAQCAWNVPQRRWMGVDFRRYFKMLPDPKNWYFGIEMQCDNDRAIMSPGSLVGIFGTYCAWEPSMPLGAKLNIDNGYLVDGLDLAGIPLRDTISEYHTQWFLVGYAHIAGRDGNVRRAAQAFQYGYNDQIDSAQPGVTPAIWAHIPRRVYGPGFYYSDTMLRAMEDKGAYMNLPAIADTAWMHAPYGYFATDAALDSLKPAAVPTCWIVPPSALLTGVEQSKLLKYAPILGADSAAKVSPIRASGKGKAWGFVDQDSSLVVLVTNTDTTKATYTVSVTGLPGGTFPLMDGLADTVLFQIPDAGSNARVFQVALASRETRPFVVQNAFGKSNSIATGTERRIVRPQAHFSREKGDIEFLRFDSKGNLQWVDIHGQPVAAPSL